MGFMMKQESGYKKTGQSMIADGHKLDGQVGESMTPEICLSKSISATGCVNKSKPGKGKVIPLRQEDIGSLDGSAKRKRVMIGLVVLMSIVLALIIIRPTGMPFGKVEKPQNTDGFVAGKVEKGSSVPIAWKVPGAIGNDVRDITGSFSEKNELLKPVELPKPAELPQIMVSGIVVYNNNRMSAIIGDELVKVGDVVKGAKVYTITSDSVVFEINGVRWSKTVGQFEPKSE